MTGTFLRVTVDTTLVLSLLAQLQQRADSGASRERAQSLLSALDAADFDLFQALSDFWADGD